MRFFKTDKCPKHDKKLLIFNILNSWKRRRSLSVNLKNCGGRKNEKITFDMTCAK